MVRQGVRGALVAGAAFLAVFLVLQRALLFGDAIVPFDGDQFFAPYYTLVADFARAGRLLLWNPFVDGGLPDFVEPQTGALAPLQLAFGLVTGGTQAGFRLYVLCVWSLGGFGILLLGRHLGAPWWGALVVALGFVFSGYQLGHAEHVSWLHSFGWLPFQIVLVDRAVARRSRFLAAQAGLVWGLALLGGYPAHVLVNGAVAVAWALGRWALERRRYPADTAPLDALVRSIDVAVVLGLMTLVGLVIMSPILAGMPLEAAGVTSRAGVIPREAAVAQNYLEPRGLATLLSPYFARLKPSLLWPATDGSSVNLYPGGVVLVLALFALIRRPRSLPRWGLAAAGVLAVMVALGPQLPLRGWLYDHVFLTRFFRHPSLFRGYAVFALAVLALLGTRDLAGATERSWKLALSAGPCALAAWLAFGRITAIASDDELGLGRLHGLVLWPALLALGVWLARAGPLPRALPAVLVALAVLDAAASERLDRWHLDRSATSRATWKELAAGHVPLRDLALTTGLDRDRAVIQKMEYGSTFSNVNFLAKRPMLRGYSTLVNDFHREWAELSGLSFAATGPGRIWFAERVLVAPPSPELFAAFVARSRALPSIPIVVHPRAAMTGTAVPPAAETLAELAVLPAAQRASFELREYGPTTLRLDVDAPADGWLLVTDRWASGWRARVNGRAVDVLGGDFVFRALAVTRGRNEVELRYEPPARFLILLSWGTLAGLALAAAWRLRARIRGSTG